MKLLSNLRQNLNLVVKQVSDTINSLIYKEFNDFGELTTTFGIPKISLNIVDFNNDSEKSQNGIRLCLTKYNEFDFARNFKLLPIDYEKKDISHLVELEINDMQEAPKWSESSIKDENGTEKFNAKITLNIQSLYSIILSFMIDIYTYYIVGLNNDFTFRANFSRLKVDYINDNFSPDIKKRYGFHSNRRTVPNRLTYISLSLKHNPSDKKLYLKETAQDYYKIIFSYVIKEKACIIINDKTVVLKDGSIADETTKSVLDDYSGFLRKGNKKVFRYLAIYNPPFEEIGINQDEKKQEKLNEKISYLLSQKGPNKISVNHYGPENCFYFLMTENIDDDIFQLFPYFDWFMIETNCGDSEEKTNE